MGHSKFEVREATVKDGSPPMWYWVLLAANGEVVSTSETYTRKEDAERAISDARAASADAEI